jgi:hypothetical protein
VISREGNRPPGYLSNWVLLDTCEFAFDRLRFRIWRQNAIGAATCYFIACQPGVGLSHLSGGLVWPGSLGSWLALGQLCLGQPSGMTSGMMRGAFAEGARA